MFASLRPADKIARAALCFELSILPIFLFYMIGREEQPRAP